jgi:hypothetical protein
VQKSQHLKQRRGVDFSGGLFRGAWAKVDRAQWPFQVVHLHHFLVHLHVVR